MNHQHAASLQDVSPVASKPGLASLDFLWLELTGRCNLECVHCYADSSPQIALVQGMCYEKWKDVLKEAFALGCRKVQFIGGEPTLHPNLLQLISYARMIGYEFLEVYTNGTFLSDEMLEIFRDHDVCLAFSVYSSGAEVHDRITRREGSHNRTIKNIRRAIGYGIPVRAAIIEMPENTDDVEAAKKMLEGLNIALIETDHLRGVGRGKSNSHSKETLQELCGACWRGQLAIDAQGNVFPCVFSRFCKIGNVSSGLRSMLHDEKLHTFRQQVRESFEMDGLERGMCKPNCAPYDTNRKMQMDTGRAH